MSSTYQFTDELFATVNGITLCYQTMGDPEAEPLLLVMGLGVQMLGWPVELCQTFADNGFYVIRYDNRDVGRSTHFESAPRLRKRQLAGNLFFGRTFEAPYALEDMADDAIGLLNYLNIRQANLMGVSMGGMISQLIALNYPDRVRTLTSIMSSTNERDLPNATPRAAAYLARPRPTEFEAFLSGALTSFGYLNGTTFPFDEPRMRTYIKESWDRAGSSTGASRHLSAVVNTPGRRKRLREISVPTLVIHGDADPLVPHKHGVDTAESIPTARLVTIRGMGHTLPRGAWPTIADEVTALAMSNAVSTKQ